jgi:hypothetical protein
LVSSATLEMQLRIENPGPRPFEFHAALHTYIRVLGHRCGPSRGTSRHAISRQDRS